MLPLFVILYVMLKVTSPVGKICHHNERPHFFFFKIEDNMGCRCMVWVIYDQKTTKSGMPSHVFITIWHKTKHLCSKIKENLQNCVCFHQIITKYWPEVLKTQQCCSENDKMHYLGPGWSVLIQAVRECTQVFFKWQTQVKSISPHPGSHLPYQGVAGSIMWQLTSLIQYYISALFTLYFTL